MKGRFIVGCCALIIGLALCVAGLWSLLSPARYQAVVKIIIKSEIPSGDDIYQPYDPYFIQTEFKVMVSDIVLSNVIRSLNLDVEWGKQDSNRERLNTSVVEKKLRSMITIDALPNPRLVDAWQVEIRVTGKDPDEAARIANAIADTYRHYRIDQHKQQLAGGIKMLEGDYQAEAVKIQAMQAQLEELGKQFDATNSDPSLKLTNDLFYIQSKRHLISAEDLHKLLEAKLQEEKADKALSALAEITEPALPPKVPIRPNRLLGAVLLVCGIGLSVLGAHLLRGHGAKL
jgi:uncharacterized protein involved in exopolysaccharide biosynthesis